MLNAVAVKCIPSPHLPLMQGNPDSCPPDFCLCNSESGKTAYLCLQNPTNDWNPETSSINKNMHSTWNPESKAWNPESNSTLDSLTWGKGIVPVPHTKKKLQKRNRRKKLIWQTAHFRCTMVPTFKSFLDMNNYYYKLLISWRALK